MNLENSSPLFQTVGVRKYLGNSSWEKETFEVEQSLPHQQCKLRGAHQAVVVRHGHPLLPLPLHLHQDLWLSWRAACEELPGVFHFPGPWLIEGGQRYRIVRTS